MAGISKVRSFGGAFPSMVRTMGSKLPPVCCSSCCCVALRVAFGLKRHGSHRGRGHACGKPVRPTLSCSQVVGISKLRTKYESHEAKRQLCNSYDLFAADERILPSLPKLLGAIPPSPGNACWAPVHASSSSHQ